MNKKEILDRIIEAYNLKSKAELARFLGVLPQIINNWYTRNTIDYDIIFDKCKDLNLEWLLYGKGNMRDDKHLNSEKWVKNGLKVLSMLSNELTNYGLNEDLVSEVCLKVGILLDIIVPPDTPSIIYDEHFENIVKRIDEESDNHQY